MNRWVFAAWFVASLFCSQASAADPAPVSEAVMQEIAQETQSLRAGLETLRSANLQSVHWPMSNSESRHSSGP